VFKEDDLNKSVLLAKKKEKEARPLSIGYERKISVVGEVSDF